MACSRCPPTPTPIFARSRVGNDGAHAAERAPVEQVSIPPSLSSSPASYHAVAGRTPEATAACGTVRVRSFAAAIGAPLIFCAPSVPINVTNVFKVLLIRLFSLAPAVPLLQQPGEPLLIYEQRGQSAVDSATPPPPPAPPGSPRGAGHQPVHPWQQAQQAQQSAAAAARHSSQAHPQVLTPPPQRDPRGVGSEPRVLGSPQLSTSTAFGV